MNSQTELIVGGSALYRQIEGILRNRIADGFYRPGAAFPTDAKLCEEFQVSRATVRVAVDALRRDGLILRHARRGSFVCNGTHPATSLRFNGSIEQLISQGDGAGTSHHIEHCRFVQPTALEAEELQLQGGEQVMRLECYRMRDGKRIGHVRIAIPAALGERMEIREGADYPSIFGLFYERLGLKVQRIRQIVSVAMPSRGTAKALGISPKVPLLVRQRTFFGPNNKPLELAIMSYPSDRYRYEIVIS